MSVATTDDTHVALFDTVTGFAFGPTFGSAELAHDFEQWLDELDDRQRSELGAPLNVHGADPRTWSPAALENAHKAWHDERVDSESGLLRSQLEVLTDAPAATVPATRESSLEDRCTELGLTMRRADDPVHVRLRFEHAGGRLAGEATIHRSELGRLADDSAATLLLQSRAHERLDELADSITWPAIGEARIMRRAELEALGRRLGLDRLPPANREARELVLERLEERLADEAQS